MRAPIAFALIAIGVILIVYGLSASDSFNSHVTRTFSGHPTDKAMWLLIIGAAAGVAGFATLTLRRHP